MIRRGKVFVLISVIVAMFAVLMPASAQSVLVYGSGATGTFSATAPLAFYTFQGQANDLVSVLVLGLTPGMQPTIVLNDMSQQAIATSTNDPFSAGSSTARLSVQLPSDGLYTVIVTPANGVVGDYAIRLDGSPVSSESTVDPDNPADSPVVATGNTVFNVTGNPDATQVATVSTSTAGFAFSALLQDAGTTLAVVAGNDAMPAFVTIPATSSTYKIIVTSANGLDGDVSLSLGSGASVDSSDATEASDATEDAGTPSDSSDATETATSESDSTATSTSTLVPGTTPTSTSTPSTTPTTGQQQQQTNPTSTRTPTPTRTPTSTSTTQQQVNATATYTPSYTPTYTATATVQQPTATYTPSYTPTYTATATYTPSYTPTTPPAAQIAPEDQRSYAFNIDLDTTASILEFVSYPGGDTEDRVVYDVRRMNPNVAFSGGRARLVISASCFGENTDQIEFFTGGQTYSCGQTIVDREVTFDSNNGSITITAVGGEGTYVQWVLTGTATRIN